MVDKTFHINFITNIEKLTSGTAKTLKDLTNVQKISEKFEKNIEKTAKHIDKMEKSMKGIQTPFENLLKSIVPFGDKIVEQNRNITALVENLSKVKEAGGFFKIAGKYMENLSIKTKQAGKLMIDLLGNGVTTAAEAATGGIGGIATALEGLAISAAPVVAGLGLILTAAAAVVAIAFTLKRMWINNIGGMQTAVLSAVAKIKTAWSMFVVKFDRMLRKLGPAIKVIVDVFSVDFTAALEVVMGLMDALFEILDPIIDAFAEIGTALNEAFGNPDDLQQTVKVGKMIADVFRAVGKIIAGILKVSIIPMVNTIKTLIGWLKEAQKIYATITGAPIAKPTATPTATPMAAGGAYGAPINTSNVTVNNNQQVSVHSSGAITPESAPMIGSVISSSLSSGAKVI